jgi:hypothetical protein
MIKKFINTKAILAPLLMLTAMWIGFLFQNLGLIENCDGSLIPLVPEGLKGVIFSPLLHGNLEHIAGNSIPIAVLLFTTFYQFYPKISQQRTFLGLDCFWTNCMVTSSDEFSWSRTCLYLHYWRKRNCLCLLFSYLAELLEKTKFFLPLLFL